MTSSEIRMSPDGRNVAIRNLRELNPKYDGASEWRASNGGYLTDAQVADWVVLQPGPAILVDVFSDPGQSQENALFDVDINGRRGASRVAQFIAGAFIVSAALTEKGAPVMVRALPRKNPLIPITAPALSVVRDNG